MRGNILLAQIMLASWDRLCSFDLVIIFYIRLWLPAAVMAEWEPLSHDSCRQPQTYVNPEAAITVFELLMMSGVSLETC